MLRTERLKQEIQKRLGVWLAFFEHFESDPDTMEAIWLQTVHCYLDNPLPSLLKEKIFTYLSRFCRPPYCLGRHAAFLLGEGHVSGDPSVPPLMPDEVLQLLTTPLPSHDDIQADIQKVSAAAPLSEAETIQDDLNDSILACATVLFLDFRCEAHLYVHAEDVEHCRLVLKRFLGTVQFNNLIKLIQFIRSAHYWIQTYPEIPWETDVERVLDENQQLGQWVRSSEEIVSREWAERLVSEPTNSSIQQLISGERSGSTFVETALKIVGRSLRECKESGQLLQTILSAIKDLVRSVDDRGVNSWINEAWCRWMELECDQAIGEDWHARIHPEDLSEYQAKWNQNLIEPSELFELEYRIQQPSRGYRWIRERAEVVRDPKGRFQGYVLTGKDITEDKKTEEGLAQSEEVFRDFVENSGDMVQSLSLEGKFLYVNQVWKDTLGYCSEDLKALSIWDIIHPDQREPCMEHMQKLISGAETPCLFETVLVTKEGISIPMEVQCTVQMANGQPIRMRAILRDITARKKAESARLQRELEMQERLRLQSIETVSHGVAHTFNNALAIIMGQAELAQFQLTPESPCATPLQEILKISEQSASIVRKLLEHTGHVAEKIEPICLSSLVESIKPLLQAAVTSRCQIQLKLHRELPRIEADPARIRQAVISLVLNGFEALPDGRGEIIVSTGVENCDRSYLDQSRFSRQAESGEYVVLEVSDNGSGMSNEVQNQLFTPFFSTKFVGRGLGLSSLLGTVRSYGGFVNWASRVNEGTTFRVFIPAKKEAF